ncbi:GNAT family N-acetyltransferase [Streptomyces sp. NPDC058175]|uniref:GNAT family N-acetyltransferase n=1 Tax=Streptomyces sp. NPDC058175 TaxID=3346367 RepID=UPI0036EA8596
MELPNDVGVFTLDPLDPMLNEQVSLLAAMHYRYLFEELARTGRRAGGCPLAPWLTTLLLRHDGGVVGFVALDVRTRAIELLYVEQPYRRHGLATAALDALSGAMPELLALKAPLTPAGRALAERLGLPVVEPETGQQEAARADLTAWEQNLRVQCRHRRGGRPDRPCKRCYRNALEGYVEDLVVEHAAAIRAGVSV